MAQDSVLLGDLGGTNARFALLSDGEIGRAATLSVAEHAGAAEAIAAYIAGLPPAQRPKAAALACAGPVADRAVTLTNSGWRLEEAEIARRLGFARVRLVNDFAAQAWALARLSPGDLHALGGTAAEPGAPAVVLGPGTGLGIATYLPPPAGPAVLVGEGGHATMAATDAREAAVLAALRDRFDGHVSAERVLSGEGLVQLYETLAALDGRPAPKRSAAGITAAARAGRDADCAAALELFCAMLGALAGNLALTLGARGGVYIAGGIAPRILDSLAASAFRARFEAKGRFRSYLAPIPAWIVLHPAPAFLGLAALCETDAGAS